MKWIVILAVALFSGAAYANPPFQNKVVKNQNVLIQERRVIDVPGYYPSAVGIDVLTTGANSFYGRLADATVDAEKQKQIDSLASEVKSLRNDVEFLKKIVLALQNAQGGTIPVLPQNPDSIESKIVELFKEKNCNECHNKTDPRGKGLVMFNEKDELWVRRKVGDTYEDRGIQDWLKILDRIQRTPQQEGFMPKDGEAMTVTETQLVLKYMTEELTKEKPDEVAPN